MTIYSSRSLGLMRSLPDIPAVVLCAFVLMLVSPACQAMGGGKVWLEICGYNGVEKVAVDIDTKSNHPLEDPNGFDNCALCQIKAGQFYAPDPVQTGTVLAFEFLYHLTIDHQAPPVLFRGYHFDTRGPPLV